MDRRFAARNAAIGLGLAVVLGLWTSPFRAATIRADETASRGTRTLYLIRHGLYDEADPRDPEVGKALIVEGREQARLTGARFAAMTVPITMLFASPMTRARETAEILAKALPYVRPDFSRDLRECTPPTDREDIRAQHTVGETDSCRQQLERAFARHFRPTSGPDSSVAIVCHGNVIRYLWCRAFGVDPKLWSSMMIGHCSVTVIQIRPDSTFRLVSFGDVGHLPPVLQTYSGLRRVQPDSLSRR